MHGEDQPAAAGQIDQPGGGVEPQPGQEIIRSQGGDLPPAPVHVCSLDQEDMYGPGGRVQNGLPGGAETERLHHQACGQAHQHNSQACHRLPGALTEADEARVEYSE